MTIIIGIERDRHHLAVPISRPSRGGVKHLA
jgi:hypothetical protein